MKVNLLLDNPRGVLSGYINVDPIAPEGDSFRASLDITNFDAVCDDAEAAEINAIDILTYFPARDINDIFTYWLTKLRHGGILRVGDVDLLEVAKSVATGAQSLEDINLLLYGEQDEAWRYRKCCLTVNQVADALKAKGFKIQKKRVHKNQFIVEAQRP
jgi:hypothetical protein